MHEWRIEFAQSSPSAVALKAQLITTSDPSRGIGQRLTST